MPGGARDRLYTSVFETFMKVQDRLGLERLRTRIAGHATGSVLELGVGTGRNLPLFDTSVHLVGIDPDPAMLARAGAVSVAATVDLVQASAEDLPFADDSFDTVTVSLTLCTIPSPDRALQEVRRVLKPAGRFLFLEHVRSERPLGAFVQRAVTPGWSRISRGCHLDRDTLGAISAAGFEISHLWRSRGGDGVMVQGEAVASAG